MRPLPVPDPLSAPYWDAAARHVLALPRCSVCGTTTLPPDVSCPHCGTTEPAWVFEPVDGNGRIRSWTVVHRTFLQGFTVPFVLVDVELEGFEDLRLIGRLLDGVGASLALGDRVMVAFEDIADGMAVPAFRLERGQ